MAVPTHYEALSDYLGRHVRAEQGALDAYAAALEGRPDDVASYLIAMILADEERHHGIFLEIQNSLESRIQWRDIEPSVPPLEVARESATLLLETTEELLALEREDARELKALRKQWSREPGERQLWALLVETAELDTKKHIRILEFLRSVLHDAAD